HPGGGAAIVGIDVAVPIYRGDADVERFARCHRRRSHDLEADGRRRDDGHEGAAGDAAVYRVGGGDVPRTGRVQRRHPIENDLAVIGSLEGVVGRQGGPVGVAAAEVNLALIVGVDVTIGVHGVDLDIEDGARDVGAGGISREKEFRCGGRVDGDRGGAGN